MQLASRFGNAAPYIVSDQPLTDDQIRTVAPSIYAVEAHESRSERYGYIPTIDVLSGLRREGFQPFMVAQTKVRQEGRRDFTKHMLRLRHEGAVAKSEANEVILINSHDGSSSYQMLAGMFRFVCMNGMVCGDVMEDIRFKHTRAAVDQVVAGAYQVLEGFDLITERKEEMAAITLDRREQEVFAEAALGLKYEPNDAGAFPVAPSQILSPRRFEDRKDDLWTVFNRVQENVIRGGLDARSANGRRTRTREVAGIDSNVKLNRALWVMAERMKELKAA